MSNEITLVWQNLSASIGGKVLVEKSTGYATPGSTLAIMGPSGAGKTTLLSMLACKRAKKMEVSGSVMTLLTVGHGQRSCLHFKAVQQIWELRVPK
mgnify:CR=1 FL=1|jgi:ABC-type multidrug transport system ATPase subunit